MKTDPRIDAYIDKQAEFAKPILKHLREAVHAACPECEETLKWSMPTFMYKGGILASMAAFKSHATFGFWKGSLVVGDTPAQREAMGQFGRIESLADLPERGTLQALVRKAKALADAGVKPARERKARAPLEVPADLRSAIDGNAAAAATFESFPPSCRREYVEWVTEAKRDDTRARRIAQTVEWLAEGKKRNWKYEAC